MLQPTPAVTGSQQVFDESGLIWVSSGRSAAQDSGQYLVEGMWNGYLPAIRKAQEWAAAGRIGEELRDYDARIGGACVLDTGINPIAIAGSYFSGEPHNIQVVGRTANNGVEDDVSAIPDYGHALATLSTIFRCR